MGCVSSKLAKKELKRDIILNEGGEYTNHVVNLTSSTYGQLNLEREPNKQLSVEKKMNQTEDKTEVINTWELMQDLEEGVPDKKSPKSRLFLRGFDNKTFKSPLKLINQIGSPKKVKKSVGKENKPNKVNGFPGFSPKTILKQRNSIDSPNRAVLKLNFPVKSENCGNDSVRKSVSPMFDPELVASYERELSREHGQIKMMISTTPVKTENPKQCQCPPRGENAVVFYSTTLRGIRKTFEDCNKVRSIMESHQIQVFERDVSMDSGFKEEIRGLMGTKEVKVPLLFVKGTLLGGVEEVMKLEEEGKLGHLFSGIPLRSAAGCQGCAGVRFVLCRDCNGSCKVLDQEHKSVVKCGKCNENGLVICHICC